MYIHSEYILTEAPILRMQAILPKPIYYTQINVNRFDGWKVGDIWETSNRNLLTQDTIDSRNNVEPYSCKLS